MTEFKVGDKVIIADLYELDKTVSYPFGTSKAMKEMSGREVKIMNTYPNNYLPSKYNNNNNLDGASYRIDRDGGEYCWANIMFKSKKGNLIVVDEEL